MIFDLDNDGDLDIVTNDFNSEPMVLISDLAQQKKLHWIKIRARRHKIEPQWPGRHGPALCSNGQTQTRYNDGKSGYLSQSALPLYFGLGENSKIDRIEVNWPSGRKQAIANGLRENELLKITEPSK